MRRSLVGVGRRARGLRRTMARLRLRVMVAMRSRRRTGTHHHRMLHRARRRYHRGRRLNHRSTDGYIHMHSGFGFPCCGCNKQHTGYTKQTFYYFVHNVEMGYCTK